MHYFAVFKNTPHQHAGYSQPMPSLPKPGRLWRQWTLLALISAALSGTLAYFRFPAAILLGCMVAAIALATHDVRLEVPRRAFLLAQGVLGCLIAKSLQSSVLVTVAHDWPIFIGTSLAVMGASAVLGWLLMRSKALPGTTAVWGLAPGAASVMVLMAGEFGADVRLVAFMQYLRVVLVTAVASLVARLGATHTAAVAADVHQPGVFHTQDLGLTLLLALGVPLAADKLRLPAGALLAPMLLGIALQALGVLSIELPLTLLALAYGLIGWSVGLRFDRAILLHAVRLLPKVLGAIMVLIALGAAIAMALHYGMGISPLTAYLATSPGGADSVAIIAATSAVDAGFVVAMQVTRFAMVLVLGPKLSRAVARSGTRH